MLDDKHLMKKFFLSSLSLCFLPCAIAVAQTTPAACKPPQAGEYIVLVINQANQGQQQLQQALPANTNISVCKYLDNIVTRLSGWTRVEDANSWAQYITQSIGLSAFVAKPSETAKLAAPSPKASAYNPQTLGTGYAVLVNYFNKPEVATQVRQTLVSNVGLVSYGQRPYLLAVHTSDPTEANTIFQNLSDRGFWTIIVDSRRVTLLKASVSN